MSKAKNAVAKPVYMIHEKVTIIKEDFSIRHTLADPTDNILDVQLREVVTQAQHLDIERPPASHFDVIRVVNIETGAEHWMVPKPPQALFFQEPDDRTIALKRTYRITYLLLAGLLMILTLVQLFFWVLFVHIWPIQFTQDLLKNKRIQIISEHLPTVVFVLGIHPLFNGAFGLVAIFCCRDKCLKTFFLRSGIFCLVSFAFMLLAIYFTSSISRFEFTKVLEEGIDLYDLYNSTKNVLIDDATLEKAKHYHMAWNVLQSNLKCCGINDRTDWISQRQGLHHKVPNSCCLAYRPDVESGKTTTIRANSVYDEDIEYCQTFPDKFNSWEEGCIGPFFEFVGDISTGFILFQLLDVILVVSLAYFGMLYHICRLQELNNDYDYPFRQCLVDMCCVTRCVKLKKPISDQELQQLKEYYHWNVDNPTQRTDEQDFTVHHRHDHTKDYHAEDENITIVPLEQIAAQRISRSSPSRRSRPSSGQKEGKWSSRGLEPEQGGKGPAGRFASESVVDALLKAAIKKPK